MVGDGETSGPASMTDKPGEQAYWQSLGIVMVMTKCYPAFTSLPYKSHANILVVNPTEPHRKAILEYVLPH